MLEQKHNQNIFTNAQELRENIVKEYPMSQELYYPLSVAYFWPTMYCPIGCEHCMYSSPKPRSIDRKMIVDDHGLDNFIQLSKDSNLETLVISGGGEPMLELPSILRLIREAKFKYFEITTGGHWLLSDKAIIKNLSALQEAISERKTSGDDFDFNLRLSVDIFHQKIVKPERVKKFIDVMRGDACLPKNKRRYPDINFFLRALLIEDSTVNDIANLLGARLTDLENYMRELYFDDDLSYGIDKLLIFYKDMRFIGKGKDQTNVKLMEFDQYFNSYSDSNEDIRLGMTYLKPGSKGEILSGINVLIQYDGSMMPYGGVSDVVTNIYFESYQQFISKLFRDIISRTLLFKGINYIKTIAEEIDPNIAKRVRKKNWVASVVDESLATSESRLYVSIRLFQEEVKRGAINLHALPQYVQELILLEPEQLRNEYYKHILSKKSVEKDYIHERIKFIDKQEK